MKLRRVALLLAALLAVLGAPPAGAAADENPYWHAESTLPVETIQGSWTVEEDGRSAALEFNGINLVGQETTFEAGWRTRWFRGTFVEEGSLSYSGGIFADGTVKVMSRDQVKGGRWSRWYVQKLKLDENGGGYGWGSIIMIMPSKRMRSEWRIIGTVSGDQSIEGSLEVSI